MKNEIEFYDKMYFKDRTIKYRLKDIFDDNWDNFIKDNPNLKIRDVVFKEVDKMRSCRTSELGYSFNEFPYYR